MSKRNLAQSLAGIYMLSSFLKEIPFYGHCLSGIKAFGRTATGVREAKSEER